MTRKAGRAVHKAGNGGHHPAAPYSARCAGASPSTVSCTGTALGPTRLNWRASSVAAALVVGVGRLIGQSGLAHRLFLE